MREVLYTSLWDIEKKDKKAYDLVFHQATIQIPPELTSLESMEAIEKILEKPAAAHDITMISFLEPRRNPNLTKEQKESISLPSGGRRLIVPGIYPEILRRTKEMNRACVDFSQRNTNPQEIRGLSRHIVFTGAPAIGTFFASRLPHNQRTASKVLWSE